eukprot:CAMPEP_0174741034 /NCGR_PEP_ID=MMETSP1094-20130205/75147_1 /TAXON_ID=156173 /ORGANISM="Chrysochromulina brevifilum, Strain UTEX LB 985" /LENGTH=70 /DNA_ID=CAMNT_0015944853 /DNA_START=32 /DNA_END=244 /DNA_ORIENTATION=+
MARVQGRLTRIEAMADHLSHTTAPSATPAATTCSGGGATSSSPGNAVASSPAEQPLVEQPLVASPYKEFD